MKGAGLTQSARFICIALALVVHAAAAAAFMLAPPAEPPKPSEGVEIEMLAEITAEVADELTPAVAAQAVEASPASEMQPGEAQTVVGAEVDAMAARDVPQTDVTPTEAEEVEKPQEQPVAEETPEVKPDEKPVTVAAVEPAEVTATETPVELEKPVVEAPEAPVLAPKAKPAVKKEKKAKAQQRRAVIAGASVNKTPTRKGMSQSRNSGGAQASAAYRSIVFGRIVSRRSAMVARMRQKGTKVLRVSFSISASGQVSSASVSKSSGDASLDTQIRAIIAAIDFPPPPPGARSAYAVPITLTLN
ncbi:MAG: TonB family protein [Pseudomonadota bacterium]